MWGHEEKRDSLSFRLAGPLGALLGAELTFYLAGIGKNINKRRADVRLSQEQNKAANLLKTLELQLDMVNKEGVDNSVQALLSFLQQVIDKNNKSFPKGELLGKRIYYYLFTYIGDFFLSQGHAEGALYFWKNLYGIAGSGDIILLKKMTSAYYALGRPYLEEAEQLYREALRRAKSTNLYKLEVFTELARLLSKQPRREEEALFIYREALTYCRSDVERVYIYRCLLELTPGDVQALWRLGKLYARLGIFLEAKKYLGEAFYQGNNKEAGVELIFAHLYLNEIPRAQELLDNFDREGEDFAAALNLARGFLLEKKDNWEEALAYYENVPYKSPLFLRSRLGQLRIFMYREDYSAAETLLRGISPGEFSSRLEEDYIELLDYIQESVSNLRGEQALLWQNILGEMDPQFYLKRELVKKRSLGQAFWRKYEALEVIGEGPCSYLLLGRDRATGEKVAVKQLNWEENLAAVRRIQGQLGVLRKLEGNYSVCIYEDCFYGGNYFYAMEYMERGSLQEYTRGRVPLPVTEAAHVALKIAGALNYFYARKNFAFHGAVKPENIFITHRGEVKLSDMDFLWALEGEILLNPKFMRKRPAFLRSFLYMAPERFGGKGMLENIIGKGKRSSADFPVEAELSGVDQRSDLYSLGVVLFELVTGFLPYSKHTLDGIISFHRSSRFPSPRRYNSAVSSDLEEIITCLLEPDPAQRFAAPADLIEALKKARIV